MAHVELQLSEPIVPGARQSPENGDGGSLRRWATAVADAVEPCLVIDQDAVIVASSLSCGELLGLGAPGTVVGRSLHAGVLSLIDFTARPAALAEGEVEKIPPLLALSSGRLTRGLMRVRCDARVDRGCTVDAVATPLWEGTEVVGSLTFFAEV